MMIFTTYKTSTGEIVGQFLMPDLEAVMQNLSEGEWALVGGYNRNEFYIEDGDPVRKPTSPGEWAVWDYVSKRWLDPRNPETELASARAAASMSRSDFVLATIRARIIQPSDAGPAARGEIPPSLTSMFDSLPSDLQTEAIVRWGAATVIERNNPVLEVISQAMGLTAEGLDALFGIHS